MRDGFRLHLGRSLAPPRFVTFGVLLVVATAIASRLVADPRLALLTGFDVAALVFLLSVLPLLNDDPRLMRRIAQANDANRAVLLAITVMISTVILFAIATLIVSKEALHWQGVNFVVGTLVLTWLFANTVFALHYAHLYYLPRGQGDRGGLDMPRTREPNYWDFLYSASRWA